MFVSGEQCEDKKATKAKWEVLHKARLSIRVFALLPRIEGSSGARTEIRLYRDDQTCNANIHGRLTPGPVVFADANNTR